MDLTQFRLRGLGLGLKIALTCMILVMTGGLVASVLHMHEHYHNKDEQPEFTMDDVIASFHGIKQPSRLLESIKGDMRQYIPTEEEFKALTDWLESDRISEDYDSLELGDFAPAEILALNCLNCHSKNAKEGGDIGSKLPFDYWDEVKQVAFKKEFSPTPDAILITSTHTHALTMPLVGLAVCFLFLFTGLPKSVKHGIVLITFFALLMDIGGWWLARFHPGFCYMIVIGGAVFGGLTGLQLLLVSLEIWFGNLFSKSN